MKIKALLNDTNPFVPYTVNCIPQARLRAFRERTTEGKQADEGATHEQGARTKIEADLAPEGFLEQSFEFAMCGEALMIERSGDGEVAHAGMVADSREDRATWQL